MFGLALNDAITSISAFILPFATPASIGLPLAIGSKLSCRLLPLFVLQGFGSFYYCGVLGLYFLLVIRYGWSEQTATRWLEPWVHILPWLSGWATSIALFFYKRYTVDPLLGMCTIDFCAYDENGNCLVSKKNDKMTQPYLMGAFSMAIIGIVCTWLVYWTVHMQEKSMQRYSRGNTLKQRKAVAMQTVCYSLACVNGIVVSLLVEVRWIIVGDNISTLKLQDRPELVLYLIPLVVLFPLQGFFNWIIYCRPLYVRLRGMHPDESRLAIYRRVLMGSRPSDQRLQGRKADKNQASSSTYRASSLNGTSELPLDRNEIPEEVDDDDVSLSLDDIITDSRTEATSLDISFQIILGYFSG